MRRHPSCDPKCFWCLKQLDMAQYDRKKIGLSSAKFRPPKKCMFFWFGKHIYTIYISLYQPLPTTYLPLSTLPILRLPPGWKRAQCFKPNLSPASMVMMGSPEGTNGIPRLKLWIERTWSGQVWKVLTWGLGVMKQKNHPLTAPLSSYDVSVLLTIELPLHCLQKTDRGLCKIAGNLNCHINQLIPGAKGPLDLVLHYTGWTSQRPTKTSQTNGWLHRLVISLQVTVSLFSLGMGVNLAKLL